MILSHAVHMLCAWQRYRRCVHELSMLTDLELTDIGLTRSGIMAVAWRTAQNYLACTKAPTRRATVEPVAGRAAHIKNGEPAVKTEKLSLKTDAVSARWRARYAANARSRLLPAISYA